MTPIKYIITLTILTLSSCTSLPSKEEVRLTEIKGFKIFRLEDDTSSIKLQKMITALIETYDLSPVRFRTNLIIIPNGRPHTPPHEPFIVFGAHSRTTDYTSDPIELLSTVVHEELHVYLDQFPDGFENAKRNLRIKFPPSSLPREKRELADDLDSTYEHLIVCWLEYEGLSALVGSKEAKRVMSQRKMYRWIYDRVLDSNSIIASILEKEKITSPFILNQ